MGDTGTLLSCNTNELSVTQKQCSSIFGPGQVVITSYQKLFYQQNGSKNDLF